MNELIKRSNEARMGLRAQTGMDDLTYHLMILESGCTCLDNTLRPVNAAVSRRAVEEYRSHLSREGWWTWFEMFFRSFEIRIWAAWTAPDSLVPYQTDQWRREELVKQASTLFYTGHYHTGFDHFLKMLEERNALRITLEPEESPKEQMTHA